MQQYCLFIWTTLVSFELCRAGGTVSLELTYFTNSKGKVASGRCCDLSVRTTFMCHLSPCDHSFLLCLDEQTGSTSDMKQCSMGSFQTSVWHNKNDIAFGKSGENPEFNFQIWPGGARLKVKVTDVDLGKIQLVDHLSIGVQMKASSPRAEKKWKNFTVQKRTKLQFRMAVFCHENYYGPKCEVYCKPSDSEQGNYSCTTDGHKQCHENYYGPKCEVYCKPSAQCSCTNDGRYDCGCALMELTKPVQTFNLRKTPGKAAISHLFELKLNFYRCVLVCIEHPECGSFNYNKKGNICQIISSCGRDLVSSAEFNYWQ